MRVHRSIYSSRADLKSANTRIENKVTNILEPLASIGYSLGFDYQHGLLEAIWKELLKTTPMILLAAAAVIKYTVRLRTAFSLRKSGQIN
ncbi:hypothetical protein C823_001234 [Eubacterium plexicaudatum ASF492]|nr:hypothetical protein C823_001234 [Eubacterium plexicaudatum ASF492]